MYSNRKEKHVTHGNEKIKIALVTGGSSGIGWSIANELAQKNYSLLLVSNQREQLEKCKTEIEKKYSVRCFVLTLDLTETSSAQKTFDFCSAQNIEVEILVNNAGILVFSEAVDSSFEKINAILQLHIYTPTMLCRLFGAEMKKRKSGFILNVSSISSVMPYPGISLYGPTKTYMRYFTRALRSEMKEHRVSVTCLIPGATETALYDPKRVNILLAKKLGIMHAPEFVATKAIEALLNKKAECIPGIMNKVVIRLMPFIPTFLIELVNRKTNLLNKGTQSLG